MGCHHLCKVEYIHVFLFFSRSERAIPKVNNKSNLIFWLDIHISQDISFKTNIFYHSLQNWSPILYLCKFFPSLSFTQQLQVQHICNKTVSRCSLQNVSRGSQHSELGRIWDGFSEMRWYSQNTVWLENNFAKSLQCEIQLFLTAH